MVGHKHGRRRVCEEDGERTQELQAVRRLVERSVGRPAYHAQCKRLGQEELVPCHQRAWPETGGQGAVSCPPPKRSPGTNQTQWRMPDP